MKSNTVSKIVIVGGGSAGWMTAATLISIFPNKHITLIEAPNIPIIGVGESTTNYMREWTSFIGLKDEDWMAECDATYKFGLKFVDFAEDDFYYPFGLRAESTCNLAHWFTYAQLNNISNNDFGKVFYDQLPAMEQNRIPNNFIQNESGYHFDAVKFANFLREKFAKPKGVIHIQQKVVDILQNDNGIESIKLDSGETVDADIYFDCTGFAGILIDKTLKTPWISFQDKLCNNRTWAARIPYSNKEEQLKPYTTCTALSSGWVWNVPLWNRIGTGYNYCDKFISSEDALLEFKNHLGAISEDIEFRDISWPTGVREKVWNKNVVAIGLSGGFIEPLESGGLYSVHEFLNSFLDVVEGHDRWDGVARDSFNWKCRDIFTKFADFVELHYTMSRRDDSDYWKWYTGKENIVDNNSILKQLFDYQHHSPYSVSELNNMWFGLSMLVGGYKYSLRNQRKLKYFSEKFPEFKLADEIVSRIQNRLEDSKLPQTQYLKNIDFYEKHLYKK